MLSITKSLVLQGLDGIVVDVEVDVSSGMPSWDIVGLPDISIRESKERVKTAIKNCGISLPSRKYIINLSPANVRKEGSFLDLAIAIGILKSLGIIKNQDFSKVIFIGELSLEGKINKVNGVLPICMQALKAGINQIIVPQKNLKEASIIKGIDVMGVDSLDELILYLNDKIVIDKEIEKFNIIDDEYDEIDFADVKGQNGVKRGLEIAVAGRA